MGEIRVETERWTNDDVEAVHQRSAMECSILALEAKLLSVVSVVEEQESFIAQALRFSFYSVSAMPDRRETANNENEQIAACLCSIHRFIGESCSMTVARLSLVAQT